MRIEQLILDGFKSYAVRTVIQGFDPEFNAITGLNGSGKSNILDSICFVLGITNMSTVRAQNLQDLIYKRGQAGVNKASVTIVFANDDNKSCPIGFAPEDFPTISVTRQVVMGGISKYLINGHRAQQQTVQNLFQSVGLNVNNPNFLIMQGKITKVLNMKPSEILSMIEEAAGTRMFEERKDKAIRSISKKEAKVQEINILLAEEIAPKLEKLRTEKRAWLEFQQVSSELEKTTKMVVAYEFVRLNEKLNRSGADMDTKRVSIQRLEESQSKMKTEIRNLDEDIDKIKSQREVELRRGGNFGRLEKDEKDLSHQVVRMTTELDLKGASLREEELAGERAGYAVTDLTKQLEAKRDDFAKLDEHYSIAKNVFEQHSGEFRRKEELLQTLNTGVSAKEGQENGYFDLLQDARNRASQAVTEREQAKLKIINYEARLKENEPRVKKAVEQNKGLLRELDALRNASQTLHQNLNKLECKGKASQDLIDRRRHLQKQISEYSETAEHFRRKVANVDFTFSDPTTNFDRTQVKGLVVQLFTLDEQNFKSSTALEVCAGGRLYNVVVENEKIGSQLLTGGNLRKRVTIIPLNKISAFKASAEAIGAAQKLAPGKVDLALSLIGYDEDVTSAMEYVFGSTLVCADADTAKRVTFDPAVKLKSVTLDGDVYDPSGTLSGGSRPNSSGVLVVLQKLNEVVKQLNCASRDLKQVERHLEQNKAKLQEAAYIQQQLDLKDHEVRLTEERIQSSSDSLIIKESDEINECIKSMKDTISKAKNKRDDAMSDIEVIERDMEELKCNKSGKLMAFHKEVEKLKSVLSQENAELKSRHREFQEQQIEIDQIVGDLVLATKVSTDLENSIADRRIELDQLRLRNAKVKDQYDLVNAELCDERSKLTAFDDELESLQEASRHKTCKITEAVLEAQQLKHEIERVSRETQSSRQALQTMVKEHDWIDSTSNDFGKPGSVYDWTGRNMMEAKAYLKQISEKHTTMKKRVNAKVMNMIDGVEKKETSLTTMVRTIHKDKKKIEDTIVSLDQYKLEALEKTWKKVTVDFGNIFGELLPGNTAKLVPVEGKELSDGLEVKVCLGKVWKQSLTELSGGQRSLIALSLIMSLLQFKPAPMYILDEVDAALDLSHTQNIGRLIKTRFKGSQFIVVSLKEGMFTNANRLFRTRFMDNTSIVSVGPEPQKGEGRIRRSIHSANGLINTPHPEIATVYDIVQYAAKSFGSKRAMGYRQLIKEHIEEKEITKVVDGRETQIRKTWSYYEYAPYEYISYIELEKRCQRLGAGLRAIGLQIGNKLEIYAGTSMFWMLMAQAANTQSMPIVTAYDTLGEEGLHHSLEESEASAIFTDAHLLPTLERTLKGTSVRHVIFIGTPKAGDVEKLRKEYEGLNVITFDELENLGERNPIAPNPPKPDDLLCIMYTSGSTGAPKGVLITHRNIVAAIAGVDKAMNHHINAEDYLIAFLPLAHIFEFMFETITLYWGGTLGYATVKTLTDANMRNCKGDLAEFRPTIMVGVPAVWENVRKGIVTKVNAGSAVIQKLFWGALAAKSFMTQYGIPGRGILDAVVFKKVKAATGGRLRYTLNGGAPLSKDTQNFLSMVMCPLLMGYGLTETCATCTVLAPEQWTLGSGGAPLACLEVKLVDVPDAGYASTNKPQPQGEIWLRGDSITSGYLNRDTENAEAFEDGWFKTGDIAQWEANGLITLIDRKKNLVKTLNGEYIALEKLESIYRTCGLATNVCVYADQQMAKPVALVVVNELALKKFAEEKGIAGDHQDAEDMCKDKKIVDAVLKEILAAGRQGRLNGIELVANVVLIDEEFTPQNGMVTSAQKLNRRKIQEKYQDRINAAYKDT